MNWFGLFFEILIKYIKRIKWFEKYEIYDDLKVQ